MTVLLLSYGPMVLWETEMSVAARGALLIALYITGP